MKEVRRQTISVKDNPLFSAVRKACVVNTVTTFKIKKKEGEKERERENETSVTTIGKGSLRPSSAPPGTGGTSGTRGRTDWTCMTGKGGWQLAERLHSRTMGRVGTLHWMKTINTSNTSGAGASCKNTVKRWIDLLMLVRHPSNMNGI